tara:strand:+ start:251 stop:781 length:531 start_codon:yes stop_codon:yes gene_type:complete
MKKELQEKLFEKYPAIFRQKDLSAQETAMCWGLACGDGWYVLIDELCGEIQNRVNNVNRGRKYKIENSPSSIVPTKVEMLICEAVQVKEKFGGLRFYIYGGDDFIDGAISLAESMSYRICSKCGSKKDTPHSDRGWIHSTCSNCQDKFLKARSKVLDTHNEVFEALADSNDKDQGE